MKCNDSKQVPELYAFSFLFSMNIPTSKCNKQHSKPNDAKVKNTISFPQTDKINQTTSFKTTFKLLKVPKVHFDRMRSIKLANAQ